MSAPQTRGLAVVLDGRQQWLFGVDIDLPHRHRCRLTHTEGATELVAHLVVMGGGEDDETLATIELVGLPPRSSADVAELEIMVFPGGTTMATVTDFESRISGAAGFRLPSS